MTTLTDHGIGPASPKPDARCPADYDSSIRSDAVYVLFTTIDATLAAARIGHDFATAMSVPLNLVHVRAVPYPLAVDAPAGVSPLETDAFLEQLAAEGVDAQVRTVLCRDDLRTAPTALPPRSLVILAGERGWWRTRPERWRRALDSAGHYVVFIDPSTHRGSRGLRRNRNQESCHA